MTCAVCGFRKATVGDRCDACRVFKDRNARDRTPAESVKSWERQVDRVARLLREDT